MGVEGSFKMIQRRMDRSINRWCGAYGGEIGRGRAWESELKENGVRDERRKGTRTIERDD
jgi:hypothetical protein